MEQISLISDAGEVRNVDLNTSTSVRIVDRDLNTEVGKYLGLVASAREQDVRRMTISGSGSLSSASICLTSNNSSAVIVAKSFFCSTSRAENVNAASNSISRVSDASSGFGGWINACASRAAICGVGTSPSRPCTLGRSAAIILSSSFGSRQNTSNACSNSGR